MWMRRPGVVEVEVESSGTVAQSVRIVGDAVIVYEAEVQIWHGHADPPRLGSSARLAVDRPARCRRHRARPSRSAFRCARAARSRAARVARTSPIRDRCTAHPAATAPDRSPSRARAARVASGRRKPARATVAQIVRCRRTRASGARLRRSVARRRLVQSDARVAAGDDDLFERLRRDSDLPAAPATPRRRDASTPRCASPAAARRARSCRRAPDADRRRSG